MESFAQDLLLLENFVIENPFLFILILTWSMIWKGVALWKSAQLSQKWWFVAILLVNTLGILEIIYVFFIARNYKVKVEKEGE